MPPRSSLVSNFKVTLFQEHRFQIRNPTAVPYSDLLYPGCDNTPYRALDRRRKT
jgi:hypothetical protein